MVITWIWNANGAGLARGCHPWNHANDGDPANATANGGGMRMAGYVPVLKPADLAI